jgi:hypothetical protein
MQKLSLLAQGSFYLCGAALVQGIIAPDAVAQIRNPYRVLPPAKVERSRVKPSTVTTRTTAKASAAVKNTAPLPPLPYYEQLRASFKVNPHMSLAEVRADAASHAGRVIELKGIVSGAMVTPRGRTVLVNVDDAVAVLSAPSDLKDSDVLRAGTAVRLLALVGADANNTEPTLTIVAATDKPELEPLFKAIEEDDAAGDEVRPLFEMGLPQPPPARPSAIPASRPGLDPDELDPVEPRKPAFMALVRRFNRKLREDQVDEIATAVLTAGYANNMDPRFLAAIIAVESDFDPYCLSSSGAMGLTQLMPFNVKEAGITDPWNITQNITGGARLLRRHLDDYGNRSDATLLAVAAYNAGPGAVRRAGYKVPPGKQVQRYVWKVYNRYKEFAPDMFK